MTGADAAAILAATTLVVREGPFTLAAWPRGADAPLAALASGAAGDAPALVMTDDLETTALLPAALADTLPPPASREDGFALVTLSTPMAWDVVGVLATLSDRLAAAGVPLGAFAAFSRDHLLVPAARLEEALAAMAPLCAGVERRGAARGEDDPVARPTS